MIKPDKALEIGYGLELVQETLTGLEEEINVEVSRLNKEKEFTKAKEYIDKLEEIEFYKSQTDKLVKYMMVVMVFLCMEQGRS
ncbi:hypothetical protein Halha_1105 [Halobacteroides halobius DSM 5150]|uniref:Uncharacterized protein n=1 Tax=Halobacteroides halobius (strain ATCC 35273 / DSM 5150 / MD-1) TaxID=748449 RepID=L0K9L5_HALHC|nr:hypothetical protein [Halobacteroides halobius]AGB41059.1 hypothetical protein Halha_1105 [Halobacteroides halobius DSM 5150]